MKTFQYRKLRGLYGTRCNQQIFPVIAKEERKSSRIPNYTESSDDSDDSDSDSDKTVEGEKKPFIDRFIISSDNRLKSYFDVWILLLVGYSCSTTLFYVAFQQPTARFHLIWDQTVEIFFYSDFCLNFLQEYVDSDNHQRVRDIKQIANRYL